MIISAVSQPVFGKTGTEGKERAATLRRTTQIARSSRAVSSAAVSGSGSHTENAQYTAAPAAKPDAPRIVETLPVKPASAVTRQRTIPAASAAASSTASHAGSDGSARSSTATGTAAAAKPPQSPAPRAASGSSGTPQVPASPRLPPPVLRSSAPVPPAPLPPPAAAKRIRRRSPPARNRNRPGRTGEPEAQQQISDHSRRGGRKEETGSLFFFTESLAQDRSSGRLLRVQCREDPGRHESGVAAETAQQFFHAPVQFFRVRRQRGVRRSGQQLPARSRNPEAPGPPPAAGPRAPRREESARRSPDSASATPRG